VQNNFPLKEKINCPICNSKFIPDSFHLEKTHYDILESEGALLEFQNKKDKLIIRPYSVPRGTWITYCPECAYLIKFAAEIGKKEIVEEPHRLKQLRGEFEEFGKEYKYNYYKHEKPYMDKADYFLEKVDDIKRRIKGALDEVNFDHWATPYRQWKQAKNVDSFKFLILFFTDLEEFCNSQVEDFKNKEMPEKIKALNLPTELEVLVESIRELRNKIAHEVYELKEDEEELVEKTFIDFMYYLVKKQLKPLRLNAIEIEPDYDFIEIEKINYEILHFLHLYLETILQIRDFKISFLIPLLNDLGISIK